MFSNREVKEGFIEQRSQRGGGASKPCRASSRCKGPEAAKAGAQVARASRQA